MSSDSNPNFENGPSKRSRPPPPLSVPPAHVAFRMICHSSRIGGVIGKSGSVIKKLQQATGAKIRIEEPHVESPDRVVVVIAPSKIGSKIWLRTPVLNNVYNVLNNVYNGGGGGFEEEIEVSKAQEALLRVFERILEVAAETGAIAAGVGVVSCRVLAEAAQVGEKGGGRGKVVEKIRKETGCKIRVLNEKLPACAAAKDEMIEDVITQAESTYISDEGGGYICTITFRMFQVVWQIEGDILAVKKALIAVSGCLQECPPVDKTRMSVSRPEAVPRETLPDLRLDHLSQRNSMLNLPSNSMSYVSGVRPSSREAERIPTLETKQQEVSFRILCANDRIGGVIGRGGSIVRALQNETGAAISVAASVAECDERLITVSASENPESRYSPAQKAAVLVFSRSVEAGIEKGRDSSSNKGSPLTARLVVSTNQVGCLLGKGGVIVSEIRKATGTGIRIVGGDQVPKCALENDEVVQGIFQMCKMLCTILLVGYEITFSPARSGSKSAIVTNTTVEIIVPENVIGSVYGENGTNLARLRQISSAKVIVHEPRPGTTDRIIVISGTPDETQAAQSLLHAFILTGPS
ncbi:hypothetical protein C1H46_008644 [Malus baccata]|uniref:K Homology domain-containing protein n=1 Tax=Malus baccata TaxID=106549 RepID=A0A540N3U9_MALBA|nr:hypothetical protein C1H46_008644 [Malus baccata]